MVVISGLAKLSSRILAVGAIALYLHASCFAQAGTPPGENPPIDEEVLAKDGDTEINVKNADIAAIIRIFSKKTRRNFILDERVKGKVSIYLPGKISAEESIRILDSVLAYKGFAAVPLGENLWKIVPAKEARTTTIPTITEEELPENPGSMVVTRLVQLKYTSADEVRQLVSQLISADGFVNAYTGTNSLILIDTEDNLSRIIELISNLDVPFTNREMTIIPIVHAEAADIAAKLNEILGVGGENNQGGATPPGVEGMDMIRARLREASMQAAAQAARQVAGQSPSNMAAGGSAEATSATVGSRVQEPKIIADERTNAIIVVADDDTTARIRALISQLDSKVDLSGSRFWVYRCQHADAEELSDVLSGLSGSSGSRGSTGTDLISGGGSNTDGRRNMSSRTRSENFNRTQDRLRNQQRTPGQSRNQGGTGLNIDAVNFSEEFSITADPATNSLIIFGNKSDYQKLLSLLEKIDVKRRQVLVEATLLEVGLDDRGEESMAWITSGGGSDGGILASNNGSDIIGILQDPSQIQSFSIAAASAGTLSLGDAITIPTQSILLTAVQSNSNVNILSAPTLLTTDNEQAEIVVGQNVPFLSSTATNEENLNNTFNSIDRQDVGITLRLTPQISSGDVVTLKIFTEVSSVISTDPRLGPTTAIRTSETSVITKDGQMIVIGGLMSDQVNEGEAGVPYLKDIPVLGTLFRTSNNQRQRTNLLILITPRVIKDQFDARDYTLDRRDKLEGEIYEQDAYPTRSEVLRNDAMDNVAESAPSTGEAPSTIFAPAPSSPEEAEAPGAHRMNTGSSDVLEFDLKSTAAKDTAVQFFNPVPTAEGEVFIIIKVDDPLPAGARLPFSVLPQGLAGIVLPRESPLTAKTFFSPGASRGYQIEQHKVRVTPLETFSSRSDAEKLHPEISATSSSWYTLSPYEIMSLGKGPWF